MKSSAVTCRPSLHFAFFLMEYVSLNGFFVTTVLLTMYGWKVKFGLMM